MKEVQIKVSGAGESEFHDTVCYNIIGRIREMKPSEVVLFPEDYNEAVRTASSLIRSQLNARIKVNKIEIDGVSYMRVEREQTSCLSFECDLSPTRQRPDTKPFDLVVSMMGADAHLATIKMGNTKVAEDGRWYAEVMITKGSAISDAFWEQNGEKIKDYISSRL